MAVVAVAVVHPVVDMVGEELHFSLMTKVALEPRVVVGVRQDRRFWPKSPVLEHRTFGPSFIRIFCPLWQSV